MSFKKCLINNILISIIKYHDVELVINIVYTPLINKLYLVLIKKHMISIIINPSRLVLSKCKEK